ncbi:uncharacterized protein ColSpa_07737 [Colletotrichum spaethianum]|uniref:Uncharacterized protein n=1 Tax=Colletotrichum spaethianum TaxID=700344 RepID=A0AA37P8F1_9PEZI|nr:uncharacterized protein ColSpa_07737 [Colletotrichum spaethianum]GKT47556.1 hypothetical protein ColSpa_07737 [Colletotrichum spaethianum]
MFGTLMHEPERRPLMYLSREARRKKGSTSRKTESSAPDRAESGSNVAGEEGEQSCGEDGAWESAPERGDNDAQPSTAQTDMVIFETDLELDCRVDVPGNFLSPYYIDGSNATKDMVWKELG